MMSWRELRSRLVEGLGPWVLLITGAALFISDWAYRGAGTALFPDGVLDEVAHFCTALLILGALNRPVRQRFLGPVLIGSVILDVDHIPDYLGYDFLTRGTPRPYTHSLLTLLVLLILAALWRRRRDMVLGLTLGLALHLFRDLAEGNGSGVSLLWPLSTRAFSFPHRAYVLIMVGFVAIDLGKLLWRIAHAPPAMAPEAD